jgi:hypothetical protein
MVQALVAPLMARLEAAESAVSQVPEFDSRLTAIRGQAYQTQLYGSVPDIDELVTLPLFTQFVSQTIPYSGETVRSRLGAAHRSHDLKAVSAIMNDFRRFAGDSGPAPTAASLTVPVPSAAPAAGSSHEVPTAQPKVLPWSRMKEATRLKNAGRMKPEEFEKVRTLFQKAEAEQRIDYNT